MNITWESLDERDQLALARQALDRAIGIVAGRAESLASEFETGAITDHGGVEALRLFATLARCANVIATDAVHGPFMQGQVGHA